MERTSSLPGDSVLGDSVLGNAVLGNAMPGNGRGIGRRRLGAAALAGALGVGAAGIGRADAAPGGRQGVAVRATDLDGLRGLQTVAGDAFLVTDSGRRGLFVPAGGAAGDTNGATRVDTSNGTRYERVATPGWVDVTWFGAVGDGATDDTEAIRAAVAEAAAMRTAITGRARPVLHFPFSTGYRTTDTIAIPRGVSVDMLSEIGYAGPGDRVALDIGAAGSANGEVTLRLSVLRKNGEPGYAAWGSEDEVGVRLRNTQESIIHVERVMGFTIGLQLFADGQGLVYNQIHLGYLVDNHVSIDLTNRNTGWCNENLLLNGRITAQHSVTAIHGKGRIGIRITSMDGTYPRNNNNYFLKPSIELSGADAAPHEALPILIEHGQYNHVEGLRNENNTEVMARIHNESADNTIRTGFGLAEIVDESVFPSTTAVSARLNLLEVDSQVYHSGPLAQRACYYDGGSRVSVPGLGFAAVGSTDVSAAGRVDISSGDYLECVGNTSSAPSVTLDTRLVKRFVLKRHCEPGHSGRIFLLCLDADGQVLRDPGNKDPREALIKTKRGQAVSPMVSFFGGAYRTTLDEQPFNGTSDFFFRVDGSVAAVRVILWVGTNSLRLRSFSVHAVGEGTTAVTTGHGMATDAPIAIAAPTVGRWPLGLVLRNVGPAPVDGAPRVLGWQKVTDAATNVAGVDWVELRVVTG